MSVNGDTRTEGSAERQRLTRSELEAARLLASYLDCFASNEDQGVEEFRSAHPDLAADPLEEVAIFENLGKLIDAPDTLPTYGEFDLLRELGHGGMGVVYEARQRSLDRKVALKVLKGGAVADRKSIARFEREAKLTANLRHPNIVCVHSLGMDHGVPYYTMELAPGRSLRQVLERVPPALKSGKGHGGGDPDSTRRLLLNLSRLFTPRGEARAVVLQPPTAGARLANEADQPGRRPRSWLRAPLRALTHEYCVQVARAFAGAAEGLQHAHSREVIHRDLKPSNLMLDPSGDLRILDFGLAWAKDLPPLSHSREVVGTPQYMSPEQARGLTEEIGPATDIYSLGVTLYETLSWHRPFTGNTPQEIHNRIIRADPPLLRRINPDLPLDLEIIVDKCLRKEPRQRFGTAEALAQELRRFAEGKPIETQPTAKAVRWGRRVWRARHRIAQVAVLCLLAGLGAMVWGQQRQKEQEQREAELTKTLNRAVFDLTAELGRPPADFLSLAPGPMKIFGHDDPSRPYEDLPRGGQRADSRVGPILYETGTSLAAPGPDVLQETIRRLEAARQQFPEKGSVCYRLAQAKAQLGLSAEVKPLLDEALRRTPELVPARASLISFLRGKGELQAEREEMAKVAAPQRPHVESWIRAREAERNQDWEAAADSYDEIAAGLPLTGVEEDIALEVYLGSGIANLKAGRFAAAGENFERCREQGGERPAFLLLWGQTQLLLGKRRAAGQAFADALEHAVETQAKDQVAVWATLAYKAANDAKNARDWADKITQESTRLVLKAEVLSSFGAHGEALATAKTASEQPSLTGTLTTNLLLGHTLAASGDLPRARGEYLVAAQLHPQDPRPRLALGSVLLAEGRIEEARTAFEQALLRARDDEDLARAHYGLASILLEEGTRSQDAGLLEQARRSFATCLRHDPGHAAARTNLGLLLDRAKRHEEALREHRRATVLAPAFALAHYNYGFSLLARQRNREAAEAFDQAIRNGMDESPVYYNLGVARHNLLEYNEAIKAFNRALIRSPEDFEAYHGRGVTKYHAGWRNPPAGAAGIWEDDIFDLYRSVQLRSNWAKSQFTLSDALANKEDREQLDKAIEHSKLALEIDSEDARPYRILASVLMKDRRPLPQGDDLEAEIKRFEQVEPLVPAWWETHHLLEVYRKALLPGSASFASIDWRLASPITIVPERATWHFFRGRSEPPPDWMQPEFNDSSWEEGKAGFCSEEEPDVMTVLADMRGGQYLSVYLRQRFQLTNRDRIRGLELRVRANDGYIAYLNGREVDRMHSGAPGEAQAFNAPAYVAMETPKRLVTWRIAIPAASLREGENLLALHGTSRIEGEEHDFALHPSLHGFTVLDDEARRRARQMLDEFLAASPTEPARAAYFEGRVLQLDGESEKAEVFFQRARALEPGSPEPYLRIAECLRSRDRGEEGTRVLREAIRSGLHRHEILWDAWFAGQLEKAPGQILEDFPLRQADEDPLSPKPDPGKDLQWLLERFAAGKPAHIDCGAMASSVVEGVQWSRDRFYRGGWDWYIGGEAVRRDPGLVPDVPYATLRHFFNPPERFPAYRFPLLRGWYRVTFYFMEGEPKTDDWLSGPFDVLLEGQTRIENYDPRRAARVWVPDTQEVEVEVVDGFLDVEIRRRSSAKRMPSFMGMTLERRE